MSERIKNVYIIHHSHTDIGYTDLQEQIIFNQVQNLHNIIFFLKKEKNLPLKWNCETWFCVERFLAEAKEEETEDFFELVRQGRIGLSASYCNATDLVDYDILQRRTAQMVKICAEKGISLKTAMNADINGISLGARDVLLKNGIEFLYMNIHTHHGMYPLYQNQNAFFWENEEGKRLLVWNGEHYNLGNALGIVPNKRMNDMIEKYFGNHLCEDSIENLYRNLSDTAAEYEASGYPYDFLITCVSGVFSDNAPFCPEIPQVLEAFHARYGKEFHLSMVTLEELYRLICDKVSDAPVYRGAMNDWWGSGVGSTPYEVKVYKEAMRFAHSVEGLEKKTGVMDIEQRNAMDDAALLYTEHTWGHSANITNPYDTMVTNLNVRKASYAARAHEAAANRMIKQQYLLGDILRYYAASGRVKVISLRENEAVLPVNFYIEVAELSAVRLTDCATGEVLPVQISPHPRGVQIHFLAKFAAGEEKIFRYEEIPAPPQKLYTRTAWVGAERVRDIINSYDMESCRLPYTLENPWFRISYSVGEGFTSFYCKSEKRELLKDGFHQFFTPIYERTAIHTDSYTERSRLGRNVRGLHAQQEIGKMQSVEVLEHGEIFDTVRFQFSLSGTSHTAVLIQFYHNLPRMEFTLQIAKTLNEEIESIYLPLSLNLPENELWIHNGKVPMRPGIDQLPGSNMEFSIADEGILYQFGKTGILVNTYDTPLLYFGELKSHPILLCDNKKENNARSVFSWVMNNLWETNFKMDLSGFCEFRYSLELHEASLKENLKRLAENDLETPSFLVE